MAIQKCTRFCHSLHLFNCLKLCHLCVHCHFNMPVYHSIHLQFMHIVWPSGILLITFEMYLLKFFITPLYYPYVASIKCQHTHTMWNWGGQFEIHHFPSFKFGIFSILGIYENRSCWFRTISKLFGGNRCAIKAVYDNSERVHFIYCYHHFSLSRKIQKFHLQNFIISD